jgi:hypothetical protein
VVQRTDTATPHSSSRSLQPKLERLCGSRQHIVNFLDAQSMNLQDRLVISFREHLRKIAADLAAAVEQFDLTEVTRGSEDLVERWLGQGGAGGGKFELALTGILGDRSWVVGTIALDVVSEVFLHMASPVRGWPRKCCRLSGD